ncbi:MAG TPA: flagellar assembly protein FliX [Xanthobacteraceae bacterium]|nr:flagellar assembly protein FliX [Xanthobacteraceae bacterium]
MRVDAASKSGIAASVGSPRRAAGGGFSVAATASAPAAAQAAAPRAVAGLGALVALQAIDEPGERRNRAVKRGRATLDALEEVRIGLLGGQLDAATVGRLRAAAQGMAESSGDAGLDSVLAEVELRAAVELAKLSR